MGGTSNMHREIAHNWILCHYILPQPLYGSVISIDIVYSDAK